MGHRTLKRVPLNFNAPLNKVWKGYLNPFPGPRECNHCKGSGYNNATRKIADDYYGHYSQRSRRWCDNITQDEVQALVDAGRLWDFTRVPLNEKQLKDVLPNGWLPYDNGKIPTAEEVNAWSVKGIGHDTFNKSILIETRAKRLHVFGYCPHCKGKGETKLPRKMKKRYQNWRKHDPPQGEGFQLWSTTTGGSPFSPVFENAEQLAVWCADNATIFADYKLTAKEWLQVFADEHVLDLESSCIIVVKKEAEFCLN
ncbi:MAG TPA: hypothetical protein VK153_02130 [Candidatus Paceibacterota bacterium]|nr:hypothetical protein [Candidatus Paceibacterota bacterium]